MTAAPNIDLYRSFLVRRVFNIAQLPRPVRIVLGLLMLATPLLLAYVYGTLPALLDQGMWRTLLVNPVMIIYIIGVIPVLGRTDQQVIAALRPMVDVSDEEYANLYAHAARPRNGVEVVAFLIGIAFGYFVGQPDSWDAAFWLHIYLLCASMVMYGLLVWVISLALVGGRYIDALLEQPLKIDIFDISPFDPIGRQSLMLSLAFVIGVTLSLFFAPTWVDILNWLNLLLYGLLVLVTVLVFFLNMRTPHRVINRAKQNELHAVEGRIRRAYRVLERSQDAAAPLEERHAAAAELSAWLGLERRLKLTRTWPYNTEMLRTLAVSVLMPLALGLSRLLILLMAN